MKVFVGVLMVLVASCSASLIGGSSFGTLSGGESTYSSGGGNSYDVSQGRYASNGNVANTFQTIHENNDPVRSGLDGSPIGGTVQGDVKTIKVIHEKQSGRQNNFFGHKHGGQQGVRTIKVIHEHKTGRHGGFSSHRQNGQQEGKTIKIIYGQQNTSPSAEVETIKVVHEHHSSQDISVPEQHDPNSFEGTKATKLVQEQRPQYYADLPTLQQGGFADSGVVKIIKIIHDKQATAGVNGGYNRGSGNGFDDTFETLQSLKVIGALHRNVGTSSSRDSYSGSYGGSSPSNSYLVQSADCK